MLSLFVPLNLSIAPALETTIGLGYTKTVSGLIADVNLIASAYSFAAALILNERVVRLFPVWNE